MYGIIRIVVGSVFLICLILFIRKSKLINKRKLYTMFSLLTIVFMVVSYFLPLENLFITFDSPEKAYKYISFEKCDIEHILTGNNCDFIIARKGNVKEYSAVPKTSEGWKIGLGIDNKRIYNEFYDGILVTVFHYKNTDDYFITVRDQKGDESTISDDYNTEFCAVKETNEYTGKTAVTYYGHITDFPPVYTVTVRGNKIVLSEDKQIKLF